jgi:hypothetical protein
LVLLSLQIESAAESPLLSNLEGQLDAEEDNWARMGP